MENIIFKTANIPVQEAARALKVDSQTLRLLLQKGAVPWGIAYKRTKKSRKFSYLIYPKQFYECTGYIYGGFVEHDE